MSEFMRITSVSASGFKKFLVPVTFNLGHQTSICGDNDCGKTTIAEIITFVLYGVDLSGNKDYQSLMSKEMLRIQGGIPEALADAYQQFLDSFAGDEREAEDTFRKNYGIQLVTPKIDCTETVVFPEAVLNKIPGMKSVAEERDGVFTFRRVRSPKTTTVYLNGVVSTQKEFNSFLPAQQLFLSVFCPGYFQSLSKEDKRRIVSEYCADTNTTDIFNEAVATVNADRYTLESKDGGIELICKKIDSLTPRGLLKKTRELIRNVQNEMSASTAWIKGAAATKSDSPDEKTLEEDKTIADRHAAASKDVAKWENAISTAKSNIKIKEANGAQARRRAEVEKWLSETNITQQPDDSEIKSMESQIDVMKRSLQAKPELATPPDVSIDRNCPSCGQDLKQLFAEEARKVEESNAAVKARWDEARKQSQHELEQLTTTLRSTLDTYNGYTEAWNLSQRFRAELAGMRIVEGAELLADATGLSISEMQQRLASAASDLDRVSEELNANIRDVADHNARIAQRKEAEETYKNALAEREKIIADGTSEIRYLQTLEMVLRPFPDIQVSYQVREITRHLDKASIVLSRVLSSGEVRDDFKVNYDGLPYYRLSNSARMKCDLEIARMLNRVSGNTIPVFVDNAEGCTKIPQTIWEQQHILAYVRPNSELSVTHVDLTKELHDPQYA